MRTSSHGCNKATLNPSPRLSLRPTHGNENIQYGYRAALERLKIQLFSHVHRCDGCVADAEFPQLNRTPTNLSTTAVVSGSRTPLLGHGPWPSPVPSTRRMRTGGMALGLEMGSSLRGICGIQTYANFKSIDYFIMPACICWPAPSAAEIWG